MIRKQVLDTAVKYTCQDRNESYGEPYANLGCMGELMAVYKKYAGENKYSVAHDACIALVMNKLARMACGVLKEDSYIDGAAYLAMAYECEVLDRGAREVLVLGEKEEVKEEPNPAFYKTIKEFTPPWPGGRGIGVVSVGTVDPFRILQNGSDCECECNGDCKCGARA